MNHPESQTPGLANKKLARPTKVVPANRPVKQTAQMSGAETRAKILMAAQATLREDGITQASARNIARRGNFNQALIFYHFGSVEGLLIAVAMEEGRTRADNYAQQFAAITRLSELVTAARTVHVEEVAIGGPTILTQLLAGSLSSDALATGILDAMKPWMALVEQAITASLGSSPLGTLAPADDLAFATASLFVGMELLTSLEPGAGRADRLFDTFGRFAGLIDSAFLAIAKPRS